MHIIHRLGHVVGGTLLIAATTIGVGMLALPVSTGAGGFVPASLIYLLTWGFMLCTGLLLLEVCIWMPNEANLITMTHRLLGPVGKAVCWAVYLFLFVSVMIAHVAGGGGAMASLLGGGIPEWLAMIIYVLIFSPIVYLGTRMVDRFNLLLMTGVLITYFSFIILTAGHVDSALLKYSNWVKAWPAMPILLTAFTYQLIIPTLMTYMKRDVKKVRLSIILGSAIPLVVYIIWEILILGTVPVDRLVQAQAAGEIATMPLKEITGNPLIYKVGSWFASFVLTTSYVALSLAFLDFLADGFKVKKIGMTKVGLCLGIFGIPTVFALIYPGIFLKALGYAGGISCALLFGLLPPLMVWVGRYVKKYEKENPQLPGGKWVLSLLILFIVLIMGMQIQSQLFG